MQPTKLILKSILALCLLALFTINFAMADNYDGPTCVGDTIQMSQQMDSTPGLYISTSLCSKRITNVNYNINSEANLLNPNSCYASCYINDGSTPIPCHWTVGNWGDTLTCS